MASTFRHQKFRSKLYLTISLMINSLLELGLSIDQKGNGAPGSPAMPEDLKKSESLIGCCIEQAILSSSQQRTQWLQRAIKVLSWYNNKPTPNMLPYTFGHLSQISQSLPAIPPPDITPIESILTGQVHTFLESYRQTFKFDASRYYKPPRFNKRRKISHLSRGRIPNFHMETRQPLKQRTYTQCTFGPVPQRFVKKPLPPFLVNVEKTMTSLSSDRLLSFDTEFTRDEGNLHNIARKANHFIIWRDTLSIE